MKQEEKKKKPGNRQAEKPLSPAKKRLFVGIMLAFPPVVLILLEIALRVSNYGGDMRLFIPAPEGKTAYLTCNPNVARRYFIAQSIIPTPPKQLFLREKPENGYRIFVLGGSSAAGFPYETNGSFPNILARELSKTFPDRRIEVVNVSMSAVNSYTLLDLTDEILEQSPDAILIYTGHNEYYGALGVGSVQSLGTARWLVRTYLNLESFRTFLLLRDFIGWIRTGVSGILYKGSETAPSATLMESIVAEQTIPYGSELYEEGKQQFEENMDAILQKAAEKNVPVLLSELVSNIHDQPPFVSVKNEEGRTARDYFDRAREEEMSGGYADARADYIRAKDSDALRFRAPQEFNEVLHSMAKKYSVPIVPAVRYFEDASPHGLVGSGLLLEHLHPNSDGYFLLAKAFYETMKANRMISRNWPAHDIDADKGEGLTELDSVYAALVVKHLKSGWPFQPKAVPNRFVEDFHPGNLTENIAFRVLRSTDFSLEAGHMQLGEYYERQGDFTRAQDEYNALIASIPEEQEFYRKAAVVMLEQKKYDGAAEILGKSLSYGEDPFAYKWIGQVALMKQHYKEAIDYLTKADLLDAQVVFNLSRAYYSDGQFFKGDECFIRMRTLSPPNDYVAYLGRLRSMTLHQAKANSDGKDKKNR